MTPVFYVMCRMYDGPREMKSINSMWASCIFNKIKFCGQLLA